jgi:hypothetical protein
MDSRSRKRVKYTRRALLVKLEAKQAKKQTKQASALERVKAFVKRAKTRKGQRVARRSSRSA